MIHNVHERTINAPIESLGAPFDGLGQKDDRLRSSQFWTPVALDRPLAVGADDGHGITRYRVGEHEPGRQVQFIFRPRTGIVGAHELSLDTLDDERACIRHVLIGRTRGAMRLISSVVVEPLYDVVVEDLLGNAERETAGSVARPAPWSPWVCVLHRLTDDKQPLGTGWADGELYQKPVQGQGDRLTKRRQPP